MAEEQPETTAQANAGAAENPEMSEVDRRLARAQRFGVDNEETKKLQRAARFGLPVEPEKKPEPQPKAKAAAKPTPAKAAAAAKDKPVLSEEDKAKIAARAARFGVVTKQSTEAEAAAEPATSAAPKAKAEPAAKSAPAKKTSQPKELTLDEIEKIKARAERFGATDSAQYLHALEEEKRLKRAARFSAGDIESATAKKVKTDGEEAHATTA